MFTKHSKVEMIEVEKKRWTNNYNPVIKPNIVLEYNNGMGRVDLQDSYLSSFSLMKKYVKSYKEISFYLADIALFNSYVLYHKKMDVAKSKKFSFSKFRLDVTEQTLHVLCISDYKKRGTMSVGSTRDRLVEAKQWGHFPRNIPPIDANKIHSEGVKCVPNTKHGVKLHENVRNALCHYMFQTVSRDTTLCIIINK